MTPDQDTVRNSGRHDDDTAPEDRDEHQPGPSITLDDLPENLRRAARSLGWKELTQVQARTIPIARQERDLMVQSRTGTGKTAAFVLPILEIIEPRSRRAQSLVLVPTRELARQVCAEAERLAAGSGIRTVALYGGVGYGEQLDALGNGAQLIVGTPGRVLDHLMRGSLNLDDLEILVFDEADRMLSVGFYPDMKRVAQYLPSEHNAFMFSATYPAGVRSLASEFLHEPYFLSLSQDGEFVAETLHVSYEVPAMDKDRALVRIIEIENPDSAIIFTNTKATARFVSVVLQRFGYDAAQLSADLTQAAREKVLARVYQKKLRFLVATDVAARGIDIDSLSHVFIYDFPEDPEMYVHRTGRTGRAGASGEAVSLVDVLEKARLNKVAEHYGIDIEQRALPADDDVEKIVAERVTALLEARLRNLDGIVRERMRRMLPLARIFGENDDELAVIAMLLDEYYQQTLHAPPEMPGDKQPPPPPPPQPSSRGKRRRSSGRRSGRR